MQDFPYEGIDEEFLNEFLFATATNGVCSPHRLKNNLCQWILANAQREREHYAASVGDAPVSEDCRAADVEAQEAIEKAFCRYSPYTLTMYLLDRERKNIAKMTPVQREAAILDMYPGRFYARYRANAKNPNAKKRVRSIVNGILEGVDMNDPFLGVVGRLSLQREASETKTSDSEGRGKAA